MIRRTQASLSQTGATMSGTTLDVARLPSTFPIRPYLYSIRSLVPIQSLTPAWFVIGTQDVQHPQVSDGLQMPICHWVRLIQNANSQHMPRASNKTSGPGHSLSWLLSSILFRFLMATPNTNPHQASIRRSLPATLWLQNALENPVPIPAKSLYDV